VRSGLWHPPADEKKLEGWRDGISTDKFEYYLNDKRKSDCFYLLVISRGWACGVFGSFASVET